jgi:hypothetical protein
LAGKEFSTQELRDLVRSLESAGLDEVAEKITKRLEKGQALTRGMIKQIEGVRKAENKLYQEKLKQLKQLAEQEHRLNDRQKTKLANLRKEVAELEKAGKAFDKVNSYQEAHIKTSEKMSQTNSRTAQSFRQAREGVERYTSTLGLLDAALSGIERLYDNWFDLQTTITRGMGELATRTGATTAQLRSFRDSADRLRETFSRVRGTMDGWEESIRFVGDASIAMRTQIGDMAQDFQLELLAAQQGLGASADQAAQIVRTLETGLEGGNESLGDFIINIREFSEEIGANASTMTTDWLEARDSLATFGRDGGEVFRRTAQFANHFGFETRRILDMARRFDTFGQASEHVNQLNAMFGTTISSFEMMQEEDPVRRIEMITNAIREQGMNWDNMSRYQRMALAQAMGVSESEAGRLMNGETMAQIQEEQIQRQREQEALAHRQQEAQETILGIIEQSSVVFRSWRDYVTAIVNDLSEALGPIFSAIHGSAEGTMNAIRNWVQRLAGNNDFRNTVQEIADWIETLPKNIERFLPTWDQMKKTAQEAWPIIQRIGDVLGGIFDFAMEHPEAVGIALGVGAIVMIGAQLAPLAALIGPQGLLIAGVAALGYGFYEASRNAEALADVTSRMQSRAQGGDAGAQFMLDSQRGQAMQNLGVTGRSGLAAGSDANRWVDPRFYQGSAIGQTTMGLLAGGAAALGADSAEMGIRSTMESSRQFYDDDIRGMAETGIRNGLSSTAVWNSLMEQAAASPTIAGRIRNSFGVAEGQDLGLALMSQLSEMSARSGPSIEVPTAESSATTSAPVTQQTSSAPRPQSSDSPMVRIANVVLDNLEPVGRVFYEISNR